MNNKSKFSRAMIAIAILLGWKAQAEMRELKKEHFKVAQVPNGVASRLFDTQILLVADRDTYCFDNGRAFEKAKGDRELLAYVELLRQLTLGASEVTACKPGIMPAGSQDAWGGL